MITPLMRTLALRNGLKYYRLLPNGLESSSFNQLRNFYIRQTFLLRSGKLNAGAINAIFGILQRACQSDQAQKENQDPNKKAAMARGVGLSLFCVCAILFMPILVYYGQNIFN